MMDEDLKKHCFGEIISIRSGLSSIYDNQKTINQYLSKTESITESIKSFEKEIKDCEKENSKITNDLDSKKTYIENCKEKIAALKNSKIVDKSRIEVNVFPLVSAIVLLLVVGVCIIFGPLSLLIGIETPDAVQALCSIVSFLSFIGSIYAFTKSFERVGMTAAMQKDKNNKKIKSMEEEISSKKEKIIEDTKKLTDNGYRLNKAKDNLSASREQLNDLYAREQPNITKLQSLNENTYKILVDNHSSIFCESDWSYIDLILYYFNSGRADTVKEALQLVDKQLQTDQITSAINQLSNKLSTILVDGIKYLGATINANASLLSQQINAISKSVNTNLGLVLEESKLQKTLMENLNVSSKTMADELVNINKNSKTLIALDTQILKIEAKK